MNPKPKPPMAGGEHTQFIDSGPQGVSPGATRVNLIPVGDGGPGPLLPPIRPKPAPREAGAWLELVVSFAAGTKPAAVLKHAGSLVSAATAAVPELGLTYDSARTREEGDSVVLSLKPRDAVGVAVRLAEAAEVIRTATARVAADVRVRVSTGQAA